MTVWQGTKEGGVAENTTYYVFTHGKDGSVEAFPIADWYNFVPIQRWVNLKVYLVLVLSPILGIC